MSAFVNDVKFVATTTGLSDFGIPATAVTGFQLPSVADGFVNTLTYSYSARNSAGQFESGTGICNGSTIARTSIADLSQGPGIKINFSSAPTVIITVLSNDLKETLLADRTYYVRTDGSNSNTGLANTSGGAFRTIQFAIDTATQTLEISKYNVFIYVADGTYDEFLLLGSFNASFPTNNPISFNADSPIKIFGNEVTPASVKIAPTTAFPGDIGEFGAINVFDGSYVFRGFEVDGTQVQDADCDGIFVLGRSIVFAETMAWRGAKGLGAIFDLGDNGILELAGAQNIRGGTGYYGIAYAIADSTVAFNSVTMTLEVDPLCTNPYFDIVGHSVLIDYFSDSTITGSATGQRFRLTSGSHAALLNGGLTFLPGSTAGSIDAGSSYNGLYGADSFTVSTLLPVANVPIGTRSFVTDSTATLAAGLGNVVSGSGGNKVPIYCDGTNWRVG